MRIVAGSTRVLATNMPQRRTGLSNKHALATDWVQRWNWGSAANTRPQKCKKRTAAAAFCVF
ncbi:hypothetical protein A4H34_09935 [Peptidiphaga gingivicola]|uniref:Uncharacterized protein n=1 Tax=Peptidiphaga gingivicola TaxID=2741497 RepID=A0A179B129_9ACTO|nr:hypothetical protein A4H34_09935 [Peptidiphaga gingivicola]